MPKSKSVEVFQLTTGRKCERCGKPDHIDTPGRCVECAARERLANRMQALRPGKRDGDERPT
jgi:hypothetical protein